MNSAKELFSNIKDFILSVIPTAKVYLIGESLRESLLKRKPTAFEFFVETRDEEAFEKLLPRLNVVCGNKQCKFYCGKKINADKELLTVNCLYIDINDILAGVDNVQSFNNGLRDFNKGVVKLTEKAKQSFDDSPYNVFTVLNALDLTDFYIDPNTAYFIFTKRAVFSKIEKRKIYNFLKDILKKNYPRKYVSFMNTFGISKELFGVNLIESPILNHLKYNDTYELFSVLFDNIEIANLENFFVERCGFLLKDVEQVLKITLLIREIVDESNDQLEKILSNVDKTRVVSMCRLLKAMNFKLLARNLRKQKVKLFAKTELCITASTIRNAFGISDPLEINNLLEMAKAKVSVNAEFNDVSKILLYLNSERTKLCQDRDQMF
jgi:tRNA nucleotidyltransferase/poly(A) polymerase